MQNMKKFYPESRFGGFTDIDGNMVFFNRVNALLQPSFVVLDVGCGRGEYREDSVPWRKNLRILKGKVKKVIGIDIDQTAEENPFLDEFHRIQGDCWPIDDHSIDMVVCDNVVEHIDDPDRFFEQIARVLRHDGLICLRTPNRWSYPAIAATLIPNKYHARITSRVQERRNENDVFPTYYRCNSVGKLRRAMKRYGFEDRVVYCYEAEPRYLSWSQVAYFFGVLHQRFSPKFLKPVIFAFGRIKKDNT